MLSKEEVQHIAALARIGIKEAEVEKYQKDISAVLDYFKKLEELDTDQVLPIGHITGRTNSYRADSHEEFGQLGREAILKNAPETKDGSIKVKSIL